MYHTWPKCTEKWTYIKDEAPFNKVVHGNFQNPELRDSSMIFKTKNKQEIYLFPKGKGSVYYVKVPVQVSH